MRQWMDREITNGDKSMSEQDRFLKFAELGLLLAMLPCVNEGASDGSDRPDASTSNDEVDEAARPFAH